eukprot:4642524-Lingulodinium_polyedra.AAC.1
MADWNCTPEQLEQSGWLQRAGLALHVPSAAFTCAVGERVLDFCAISRRAYGILLPYELDFSSVWSPHVGLTVRVLVAPRQATVRTLLHPKQLPVEQAIFGEFPPHRWQRLLDAAEQQL